MANRRIRVGIDTGGTFTDVVAVEDDGGGRVVAIKTPSTPADPAEGFLTGIRKVLSTMDATAADLVSVSHGTTVATNQLLTGDVTGIGFVTTEGFEHLLEIARQSVPDGYGNSYFWVKPPRIVAADLVRGVGGRLDHTGAEVRPFDADGARAAARLLRGSRGTHGRRLLPALVRQPGPRGADARDPGRGPPRRRRLDLLRGAAGVPRVRAGDDHPGRRGGEGPGGRVRAPAAAGSWTPSPGSSVPFHIMKSNGGVLSADEVVHQPVTTVLSGPAAGALGAALVTREAGFDRVLTLDGGGTSTDVSVVLHGEPALTTEGTVGAYPCKIPMIDIVTVGAGGGSIAWLSPEGALKVGPRSAGADPGPLCYGRGGTEPTVTDAHLVLGRIPPHLLGGELPLDPAAARDGLHGPRRQARP